MDFKNEYAMIQQIKLPYIKATPHYEILKTLKFFYFI